MRRTLARQGRRSQPADATTLVLPGGAGGHRPGASRRPGDLAHDSRPDRRLIDAILRFGSDTSFPAPCA